LDQIKEQLWGRFHPSADIPTKFSTKTQAFIVAEENNSELTVGDGADRLIQYSALVRVETYIPSPRAMFTSTGKIRVVNIDIEDLNTSSTSNYNKPM